jgi:hypothetical protein
MSTAGTIAKKGAQLKDLAAQEAAINQQIKKATDELKLDILQAGVDAAGTFDPTPISDLIGAAISAYRGDWIGAGLSVVSAIPYIGDALGKTAKGARLAAKINKHRKKINNLVSAGQRFRSAWKGRESLIKQLRNASKKFGKKPPGSRVPCPKGGTKWPTRKPKSPARKAFDAKKKAYLQKKADEQKALPKKKRDSILGTDENIARMKKGQNPIHPDDGKPIPVGHKTPLSRGDTSKPDAPYKGRNLNDEKNFTLHQPPPNQDKLMTDTYHRQNHGDLHYYESRGKDNLYGNEYN